MSSDHPRITQFSIPYASHPTQSHSMTFYEWGDLTNPRVAFCVHGLTRNGRDFDRVALELQKTHRVICADMPGRGLSEWLKDSAEYTLPSYLAHLQAAFASLGVEKMDWIGTSMGGMIGMMLAATAPGRIQRMVINDIGAFIPKASLKRIAENTGTQTHFDTLSDAEAFVRKAYETFGIKEDWQWQHIFSTSIHEEMDGSFRLHYDPAIRDPFMGSADPEDIELWEVWNKVDVPVLLIRGATSDLLLPDTAEKMLAGRKDATLHTVAGAGHAPSLMDAEEVNLVCRWLSQPAETHKAKIDEDQRSAV